MKLKTYLFAVTRDSYLLPLVPLLAAFTWMCAQTGLDAWLNDLARLQNETFSLVWSAPPLLIGFAAPALMPLVLWVKDKEKAVLVAKTVVFTVAVVSVLKGWTSRVHPEDLSFVDTYSRSNSMELGFLKSGWISVVEGWPSGHCASNTAMALSFAAGGGALIQRLAIFWASWVALATVFGIQGDVHWFSDSVAGVVLGVVIARAHIRWTADKSTSSQSSVAEPSGQETSESSS